MQPPADAKENSASEVAPEIRPTASWRVAEVRPLPDFFLWVRFNDGIEGTVSMSQLINSPDAGVFEALRDEAVFSLAYLEMGAVTWPSGIDLSPDAMYEAIRANGEWILR